MVVNFGIAEGEIVAELEVNDVNAFLALVGVKGSIFKFVQTVLLAHLLIFIVLAAGVWITYLIGKFALHLFLSGFVPIIDWLLNDFIFLIQKISDPIVEPIADFIISSLNLQSNVDISEAATSENNDFIASGLKTLGDFFSSSPEGVVNGTSAIAAFGPYHPNFFQAFKEDLLFVFLGYSIMLVLLLLYAQHITRSRNQYLDEINRLAILVSAQLQSGIKVCVFEDLSIDFYILIP